MVEVNLERRPEIRACFTDNDPKAVLQRLEIQLGQRIPIGGGRQGWKIPARWTIATASETVSEATDRPSDEVPDMPMGILHGRLNKMDGHEIMNHGHLSHEL